MTSRRQFLTTAAATAASFSLPSVQAAALPKNKLCGFTKHLQGLSYDQIADIAAEAGLDGIEARSDRRATSSRKRWPRNCRSWLRR